MKALIRAIAVVSTMFLLSSGIPLFASNNTGTSATTSSTKATQDEAVSNFINAQSSSTQTPTQSHPSKTIATQPVKNVDAQNKLVVKPAAKAEPAAPFAPTTNMSATSAPATATTGAITSAAPTSTQTAAPSTQAPTASSAQSTPASNASPLSRMTLISPSSVLPAPNGAATTAKSGAVTSAAPKKEYGTPVGRVVWVKGTFSAIMPDKQKRHLQKSSIIYLHDMLVTDSKTQAQIVFTDTTLMTFRGGTKFYIKDYVYKTEVKKGSVGRYFMNLIEGGFRTITGLIPKANPKDYAVDTPVATIGVRGTDYAVYLSKGQLYIGNYHGAPCVSNSHGKELCLSQEVKYGYVQADNIAPVPLTQQPKVLIQKLVIVPARVTPFSAEPMTPMHPNFCIVQ